MSIFLLACLLNPGQVGLLGKLEIPGTASDLSGLSGKLNDGSPANLLGGIGSALASGPNPGEFYFLPDRGPGDGAADYLCRFHQAQLFLGADGKPVFSLVKTTPLRNKNGYYVLINKYLYHICHCFFCQFRRALFHLEYKYEY